MGDIRDLLAGGEFETLDGKRHHVNRWTMGIFFPQSKYLSIASANRMFHYDPEAGKSILDKSRYEKALKHRKLFLDCLNSSEVPFRAVVNPTPLSIMKLPLHSQSIQPWQFAWHDGDGISHYDDYQKRTLIWLKNLPPLLPDRQEKPEGLKKWINAGTKGKNGERLTNIGVANCSKDRAKTFRGIAEAMAHQWGSYLLEKLNQDDPLEANRDDLNQGTYKKEE